jgi:CDP-glycerol glycerophosphotransferase (TagB/SpsB family)
MISDFSSISFEYTLLRKPIFLFEGNEIQKKVADRNQYELLKSSSFVFKESDEIDKDYFTMKELDRDRIEAMKNIQRKYFSNVGNATKIAVNKLIERKVISPLK